MNAVVIFEKDKGGKKQKQIVAPEHVAEVKAYFDRIGTDELLFPKIDADLDLHGLRAAHASAEYHRYADLCSTPDGRAEIRRQLWARYTDPEIGCKAYQIAKAAGNHARMRKLEYRFRREIADGTYHLRGANRQFAIQHGLPTAYDRLAIMACSVFSLSHWRADVAVKFYILAGAMNG